MKHIEKYIIILFFLLNLFSCNIFKKNIKNNINNTETKILKLEKQVNEKSLYFETFSAGFSGKYTDNKNSMPLKGIIKIKKDNFIWITIRPFLGIEVARILLTVDSIKFINKINNQYFAEDYNYLKKLYGFDLNYQLIEALFTNHLISYPVNTKLKSYTVEKTDTFIRLIQENNINGYKFIHTLKINKNYFLTENGLQTKNKTQQIKFTYNNFTQINEKQFPLNIFINLQNTGKSGSINIAYKNIKINTTVNAKFVIPKNYKRIKFE
ncbi:MAG: DUF4292 domain-containing protein [Bacteroidales bacterium]|nr:DUF4292 domain-containing protein [Bacteroidales bacterium]